MRKIKSLALIAAAAFVVSCSSGNKEVEQATVGELYNKGATALQEGSYSEAIRYLNATTERFPGSIYQEQAMLDLMYANYKSQDYTGVLVTVDSFLNQFPQSQNRDYAVYMAGLTNAATADNAIQDFFGIDRATRETSSLKTAFSNFQSLVQAFPNSPYSQDALGRMAYIKDSLARHELEIAKFYAKRNADVAVANRVVGMLQLYPDTLATYEGLFLMRDAYKKMGLENLANQTQQIIDANKDKQFMKVEKPEDPELTVPATTK
ncbi:outer membrane protein assembly factor BamD [Rodentibacter genomosp. 1]|uniref:Outer membrane protein assembly factor BamD n=1 Tax=Rodentibacter genomosp. 1 TaxID=1908264 RepID=A0A1V3J447_9PAST|nr:outer membrane protein assembly factor BamD [Rodentibacter genomosp. 1]OOF49954.1 outer membrane protein assembly factor BamD [Rodentibacter genomosp. 1]